MQVSLLKKGLGNKHFSLVICSQGKNVNYIDVKFPPLFISLPEILLWKKLKSSGLQITMWSIRFENIETIIKGEVQYPRLKFVLIIEKIRSWIQTNILGIYKAIEYEYPIIERVLGIQAENDEAYPATGKILGI